MQILLGLEFPQPVLPSSKFTTKKFSKSSSENPACSHLPPFMPLLTLPLLSKRRNSHLVALIHSLKLNLYPSHLHCFNWFSSRSTRNSLSLPKPKSSFLLHSPFFTAYSAWLALPQEAKDLSSLRLFKSLVAP